MDLSALPIAALPLSPPASPTVARASSPQPAKAVPLALRFTLNPTITAKANYFDLAQTRRAPYDLRTALIWLCLCAHDNSVWWEPRTPDHDDGDTDPPLPYALNFAAWLTYIQQWQTKHIHFTEDAAVEALAIRVWLGAHETAVFPEESGQKKTPLAAVPTGLNSTPTSSPEATPADATTCSTECPSAPSTPSSTHGSAPTECQPLAPQSATAETAK